MCASKATDSARIAELEQQLINREKEISILKETSDAAAHQLDLDSLLQLIAERASRIINAETILIPVLNKEFTQYTYRAGFGKNVDEIVGETLSLDIGVCGWVWRHKRAWWQGVLDDLGDEERNKWEKEAGTLVLVPLIGKQYFLGGIAAVNKLDGCDFNKNDLDILSMFASQVTAGVENAYLYKELQSLNADLEQRVKERTAVLESTNRELESFSYSVSHDLRAPLRSIEGFSRALLEDCVDQLDETGMDYLHRILNASHRMDDLIQDLLRLSRMNQLPLIKGPVDLSELARSVINNLTEAGYQKAVDIQIEPNLKVVGDRQLLAIVLDNLLGNALKYSRDSEQVVIKLGYTVIDDKDVYFVRDNGVGFDMKYAGKLFGAFQRLHGNEFEGTGIGLATVQRIIHRHGGKIWAESEEGKGATFYFYV